MDSLRRLDINIVVNTTPLHLIDKMLLNIDFRQVETQVETILELSAGKGDIVEVLERKKEQ